VNEQSVPQSTAVLLGRLWTHINPRRRRQFALLVVLIVGVSFAEVLSIGALLPFLAILTTPSRVFEHSWAQPWIQAAGLTAPHQLLLPLTILFGVSAMVAGAMRLLLLWSSMRLSYATGADLSNSIYRNTLYQPYAVHVSRNSSDVLTGILIKANGVISYVITPLLLLISASVMLSAILLALLSIEPIVALLSFGGFGAIYVSISWLTHRRVLRNGQRIARESNQIGKTVQEGLGGIRDVLIGGSQNTYCEQYRNADFKLRLAQSDNAFIIGSPRYVMEALGMLLIAVLAYMLTRRFNGVGSAIPILGALALGAQRMLPALQQAYAAWSTIKGELASLQDTLDLLDQPLPDYANQTDAIPMAFLHQIELQQVSMRYGAQSPWIFKGLNLRIERGSRVGLIGVTGSGKSSLLDLIMGLLAPSTGMVKIDGERLTEGNKRSWQAHIACVSQAIFLTDNSIEENIAFGLPAERIDRERVKRAAQQAQISDFIEDLPEQYQTTVGERGVRLSGGQRQRIGIARALYRQADVIIFDEATSALDNETEQAVMQAIGALSDDLTVLIIAHRLTTLKNCTQIVELGGGGIKRVGSYSDIINPVV
jgi:ABC-type multidrug transport system fused ATPase/permease subunit